MILFKDLIETLRDYTKDWSALGIIRLCIDLLLVGFTLFFIYKLLRAKIRGYKLLLILLGFSFFYLLVFFLQLELFLTLLNYLIFGVWVCSSSFTHRRSGIHWNIFSQPIKTPPFYNQTGKEGNHQYSFVHG